MSLLPKKRRISSKEAIAVVLQCDIAELDDARYHYGRTEQDVWSVGDYLYTVTRGKKPRDFVDAGVKWKKCTGEYVKFLRDDMGCTRTVWRGEG